MKSLFYFLPLLLLYLANPLVLQASDDCKSPSGLQVDQLESGHIKLSWEAVKDAKGYKLEVEDAYDNPHDFEVETTVSHNYYVVSGLKANSSYKFKLRTICKDDKSDWSEDFYFITQAPHSSESNSSESNNSSGACDTPTGLTISNISANSATISWNPVGAAVNYEVEVEDGDNTPAFYFNQVTNTTSVTVSGLASGGRYKAKVKSKCSNDNSEYTQWVFFIAGQGPVGSDSTAVDTTSTASCMAPADLMVTAITDSSAAVSWDQTEGTSLSNELKEKESDQQESSLLNQVKAISLFPNPASQELRIDLPENNDLLKVSIRIYDQRGQMVWNEENLPSQVFPKIVPVNQLKSGIYHVSIMTKLGVTTSKLLVAH